MITFQTRVSWREGFQKLWNFLNNRVNTELNQTEAKQKQVLTHYTRHEGLPTRSFYTRDFPRSRGAATGSERRFGSCATGSRVERRFGLEPTRICLPDAHRLACVARLTTRNAPRVQILEFKQKWLNVLDAFYFYFHVELIEIVFITPARLLIWYILIVIWKLLFIYTKYIFNISILLIGL